MAKEEQKPKIKTAFTHRKQIGNTVFESAIVCNMPTFLTVDDKGNFSTTTEMQIDENTIMSPVPQKRISYRQYIIPKELFNELINGEKIDKEFIYQKVKDLVDMYVDAEEKYKVLIVAQIFESYIQYKFSSLGYMYLTGDQESGKSTVCKVLALLSYRSLYAINLNSANIYRYLGTDDEDEGQCTIIEDEIDPKVDDKKDAAERNKITRAGYQKGNKVPRMADASSSDAVQLYFNTYGTKTLSGYSLPTHDSALCSRCIELPMTSGNPECDESPMERAEAFDEVKSLLLAWRMQTYFDKLPDIETKLRKRNKEVWKCKLYALHATSGYDTIVKFAEESVKATEDAKVNSIESQALKAIFDLVDDGDYTRMQFKWIRDMMMKNMGIQVVDDLPITDAALGRILLVKFHGKRGFTPSSGRYYDFDRDTLARLKISYGLVKFDDEQAKEETVEE